MIADTTNLFWNQWPARVKKHLKDPAFSAFYPENERGAILKCAYSRGGVGITADPGLVRVFIELCEDVGAVGELRTAIALRAFAEKQHLVLSRLEVSG